MSQPWYSHMSPESYSRYILLVRILELHLGSRPAKVLELGGKGSYLGEIFRDRGLPYELTILDILPEEPNGETVPYLQADATATGLPDSSYDAVVSADTLEHIAADRRPAFVRESLRLARRLVVLAAPFETPGVASAEHAADGYYRQLTGHSHPWLAEHEAAGRPDPAQVEAVLRAAGLAFTRFGSNRLDSWLPSLLLNLLPEKVPVDHTKVAELNEFYNQHLLTIGDFTEPTYRQFYVVGVGAEKPFPPSDYTGGDLDPQLHKFYRRRLQAFIADEISSRYARLGSGASQNTALEREISLLAVARKIIQQQPGFTAGTRLSTLQKAARHPVKTLRHIGRRLHKH